MQRLFVAFLVSAFISSFVSAQEGYTINGHITGLSDNSKVYLINGGQRKTIDSSIVKNERFVLKGKLEEAAHTYLYAGKANKLADILLDNRQIFVTGTKPVYDSVKINGSDIDEQWKEWYKEDQRIGYLKYRLNQISKSLIEKQDTTAGNKIRQIEDELMSDRISLLKMSVKKYGNSPSGAVLPTLCTLQDKLTENDFQEMYTSLTLEMQNTVMGREILKLASIKKL